MKKLLLVALIATSLSVQAQPPAPQSALQPPPPQGNEKMPPPPPGRDRMQPPPPQQEGLQQVQTFKGQVVKMAANDDYIVDGFYMLNNSDSLLVKFPPHLGSQLTTEVKAGATVSVNGVLHTPPMGGKEIRMLTVTANGQTISDTATQPPTPPAELFVKGSGKTTSVQTDREGRIRGFILDNNTILHMPPHVAQQIGELAKIGANITYTGAKTPTIQGEVTTAKYSIVNCQTITVNGQQYLVK